MFLWNNESIDSEGGIVIDSKGFRLNVGIIICNNNDQLLLCRRFGKPKAWQFPQGGIDENELPQAAMFRELVEELGLTPNDVEVLAESKDWLSYILPKAYRRWRSKPLCIGQKQKWFLLRMKSPDSVIRFDSHEEQEFDQFRWVDYWSPVDQVIEFKREVYNEILVEFAHVLGKSERV
jgi:putative (di)nucleoside polyphosphate hydrolase